MAVWSQPVVVRGRGIEAVDLGAKRAIVLAASETLHHRRVEAPEHIANQAGFRIDQGEHDGKLRVWRERPYTEFPAVAALLVRKTTGLDLREARGPDTVPGVGAVNSVGVDQWDPGNQPGAAADDKRLVDPQPAEPSNFGALKFCQTSCLQPYAYVCWCN